MRKITRWHHAPWCAPYRMPHTMADVADPIMLDLAHRLAVALVKTGRAVPVRVSTLHAIMVTAGTVMPGADVLTLAQLRMLHTVQQQHVTIYHTAPLN